MFFCKTTGAKKKPRFGYIGRTIAIIYRNAPYRFLVCILLIVLTSLFNPAAIVALERLISAVERMEGSLWMPAMAFAGILLVSNAQNIFNALGSYLWITAEMAMQSELIDKANRKGLIHYESHALYGQIEQANQGYIHAVGNTMLLISTLCITALSTLWISAYLSGIHSSIAWVVLAIVAAKALEYVLLTRRNLAFRREYAERELRANTLFDYLKSKETRAYNLQQFFLTKLRKNREEVFQRKERLDFSNLLISLLSNTVSFAAYGLVTFFTVLSLAKGESGSAGRVLVLFVAIEMIFNNVEVAVERIGNVFQNIAYSGAMFDFLDSEDGDEERTVEPGDEIVLEDVSFSYPQRQACVIDHVHFRAKRGEKIAIVGENGSGKSTLMKLLMGMYQPTGGTIRYGEELGVCESGFAHLTGVLQQYRVYDLSMRQNMVFTEERTRDAQVEEALYHVFDRAWVKNLPDGLDTQVGLRFGGVEFSGGEKQKIAIARAFLRAGRICFFDEPTSAIDPFMEDELYRQIMRIAEGKTTFFVTHRLSSLKYADRVVVMKDGRIAESGTHEELMRRQGEYAQMYAAQKNSYM